MVTAKIIVSQGMPMDLPKAASGEDIQKIFSVELSADGKTVVDSKTVSNDDDHRNRWPRTPRAKNKDLRAVIRADHKGRAWPRDPRAGLAEARRRGKDRICGLARRVRGYRWTRNRKSPLARDDSRQPNVPGSRDIRLDRDRDPLAPVLALGRARTAVGIADRHCVGALIVHGAAAGKMATTRSHLAASLEHGSDGRCIERATCRPTT